jgi:hypothetical protein
VSHDELDDAKSEAEHAKSEDETGEPPGEFISVVSHLPSIVIACRWSRYGGSFLAVYSTGGVPLVE